MTLVVSQNNPEVLWNAFRFGNLLLNEGDEVKIFLNGPAVEYGSLDCEDYPLALLAKTFVLSEGVLLA